MSAETCKERSYPRGSMWSTECGRPVKRDGMCGIHAPAKERREANRAAREAKWDAEAAARRAQRDAAPVLLERLSDHGVTATLDMFSGRVDLPTAAELVAMLDAHYGGDDA